MPRKTYFSHLWLKLPQYKDWLRKKDDITVNLMQKISFKYRQMGLRLTCVSLNFLRFLELVVYILYMAAWKLGLKILIGILGKFLNAWRELFEKVTETCIYLLPYCGHRWCENEYCARRGELIWLEEKKFVTYLKDQPKSKQPQS